MLKNLCRIRGHSVWLKGLDESSLVIDAGAHRGEFSAELHRRTGCRCILIEANPVLAASLKVPHRGQLLNAALANEDGTAQFVFRENIESGSISDSRMDLSETTSVVEKVSLETAMRLSGARTIDLLKLDIEGTEFSLLAKTPESVLSRIGQITVEFHDFLPEFQRRGLYEAARARLQRIGFQCYPMAFRTHGDTMFLNPAMIRPSLVTRLQIMGLGPFVLKWRDWNAAAK